MSVLDLQAIKPAEASKGGPPPGSRASKQCGGSGPDNTSTLSVAICAF